MIIREQDKLQIINIAKSTIKTPSKILAYGSRVNGDAHSTSDLDLVIVSDDNSKINMSEFFDFKDTLQSSNIPILVQVMDWNRIPEAFHDNIMKNNETIVKI